MPLESGCEPSGHVCVVVVGVCVCVCGCDWHDGSLGFSLQSIAAVSGGDRAADIGVVAVVVVVHLSVHDVFPPVAPYILLLRVGKVVGPSPQPFVIIISLLLFRLLPP